MRSNRLVLNYGVLIFQVKLDIVELRKVVNDNKFEVSTFDKDEVYIYDLKKILDIALGPKLLSSQALYILTTELYNESWITSIPKILEQLKKERKTK